jgi:predicted metal-dependent peptidase
MHELWHTALMHGPRQEKRHPQIWNVACDYRINNDLKADGYEIPNTLWWICDPSLDDDGKLSEEQIYEKLFKENPNPPPEEGDMRPSKEAGLVIAAVVRAVQAAEMAGKAGELPGEIKQILQSVLEPVIPWRNVLMQWMTDLEDEDLSWQVRSRRYQDMYMPGKVKDASRLEHLVYFQDTSGSITREDMDRFNAEVKYIQETLQPEKLTLVQFDTEIQYTREFKAGDLFEDLEMHGGGGTSLRPVKEWIDEHKPTAAVIFSDLECDPMKPLKCEIPVIWAVIRNKNMTVPFGKVICIVD